MRIRKVLPAIMVFCALTLQACGAENSTGTPVSRTNSGPATVNDVLAENMAKEGASVVIEEESVPSSAEASEESSQEAQAQADASIEASTLDDTEVTTPDGDYIDLTALSGTMIYSEVYNMMYYPESYVGKVIRMEGIFSDYYDEEKGKNFYGCIITDATACCAQGVEFEPIDSYIYPDDFPEDGDKIIVEGTFDLYEDDGYTYCTLRNAIMERIF